MKQILKAILFSFIAISAMGQGTTTSGINGRVIDNKGETLPGATILATHEPTGTQYGAITDFDGYFRIPNMEVGGPYTLQISFVGYETFQQKGISLSLGQTYKVDVTLGDAQVELEEVVFIGKRNEYNIIDGNRTGAETFIQAEQIETMPTIARNLTDFTRLTPQSTVDDNGAISIAGANNRYNAISIDGAVNNDVFGLAATGTNGGQTGGTPISMDAIEQFQVVIAPYDVRQSGFNGASINAVTRRGTNEFHGSGYYFMKNENLAGKTPGGIELADGEEREKLTEFTSNTYGARLGGPIVKNKVFFFINAEIQREETPKPFSFATYRGASTQSDIDNLITVLKNQYGYDTKGYSDFTSELNSNKFIARVDANLSQVHKLTLRHSYTYNESISPSSSSSSVINFYNNGIYFPSTTNSTALELKSNFESSSNNLIIGYTSVLDDRDPMGNNFPRVIITDDDNSDPDNTKKGTINLGSEPYSTANQLDQKILTITDNFNIYKGKHTLTFGFNIEYSSTYNLFIRKNYGEYTYNSLSDFLNNEPAYQYDRSYSLVDDITGDGSKAAAEFGMMQYGVYAQDEIQVSDRLKLTLGIRADIPTFSDKPREDTHFNEVTIPELEAQGYDLEGAKAGSMPKGSLMFSPRLGFNYDVTGDQSTQIRGGVGIFTSRIPLVWPGGSYSNCGVIIGGAYHRSSWGTPIYFEGDWNNQYEISDFGGTDAAYGGQIDLFAEDFKFPQVFRASAAIDQKLPLGMIGTFEALFSKTLNNVLYHDLNIENQKITLTGGPDNRTIYSPSAGTVTSDYTMIMLGTNTNKGYSYNFTAQLQKPFENGLSASLAYTFGRSKSINDGLSSQNSSQWRYVASVNGRNDLDLGFSKFDLGNRIVGAISYSVDYMNHGATTFSLFYNGQSGDRFSYTYYTPIYGTEMTTAEDYNDYDLIYIPDVQSDINLVAQVDGDGNITKSVAQQWSELNEFIEGDDYLSKNRGGYAERFGARLPFEHNFDLKIMQDFYVGNHKLQVSLDVFNVGNLLNKNWGEKRYVSYDTYSLISFVGWEDDGTTPQFQFNKPSRDVGSIDDSGIFSSRWQAQFGVRYIF